MFVMVLQTETLKIQSLSTLHVCEQHDSRCLLSTSCAKIVCVELVICFDTSSFLFFSSLSCFIPCVVTGCLSPYYLFSNFSQHGTSCSPLEFIRIAKDGQPFWYAITKVSPVLNLKAVCLQIPKIYFSLILDYILFALILLKECILIWCSIKVQQVGRTTK